MSTSTLALILLAALIAWTAFLAPARTGAVAAQPFAIRETRSSVRVPPRPPDAASRVEQCGSDVVIEDYPLSDTALSTLQRGDRIALPHPDGGSIELRVERVASEDGERRLRLVHEGLVSTFTEGRGAFFGTLATPRGVYALEGDVRRSRLTRHALLDQRMNSHAPDYRYVPSS